MGVAGVEGNGQRELSELITGLLPFARGEIAIDGSPIRGKSIRQIRDLGVSHISEDRMTYGVADRATVSENVISDRFGKPEYCTRGFLRAKEIKKLTSQLVEEFHIKCDDASAPVKTLSGGNMQKVVVARECSHEPKVLIAEQPTRGVDVGAAHIIHKKIMELRDEGCAVLLVSADLSEVLKLSDVVAVMYEGEIVAFFEETEGLNEEKLGLFMLGLERHDEEQIRRAVQ